MIPAFQSEGALLIVVYFHPEQAGSNMASDASELVRAGIINGNPQQVAQLASAFADSLDAQSSGNLSDEDLVAAQEVRALLANGLSTLASGAADASTGELEVLAGAAAAVTSDPSQVTPAALSSTVSALWSMASAKAMDGAVIPPKGGSCTRSESCVDRGSRGPPRCRSVFTCVDAAGTATQRFRNSCASLLERFPNFFLGS